MLYTCILDDSIKSPTLILAADHSTLLFLPSFFYQMKHFLFLLCLNLYMITRMITGIYLHDPPPFNNPFFMTPPFSESQKAVALPLFPPPSPPPANFWQVPYLYQRNLETPSSSQLLPARANASWTCPHRVHLLNQARKWPGLHPASRDSYFYVFFPINFVSVLICEPQ